MGVLTLISLRLLYTRLILFIQVIVSSKSTWITNIQWLIFITKKKQETYLITFLIFFNVVLYVCVVYLLYKKWDDIMSFCILKELGMYLYHTYMILVLNIYIIGWF